MTTTVDWQRASQLALLYEYIRAAPANGGEAAATAFWATLRRAGEPVTPLEVAQEMLRQKQLTDDMVSALAKKQSLITSSAAPSSSAGAPAAVAGVKTVAPAPLVGSKRPRDESSDDEAPSAGPPAKRPAPAAAAAAPTSAPAASEEAAEAPAVKKPFCRINIEKVKFVDDRLRDNRPGQEATSFRQNQEMMAVRGKTFSKHKQKNKNKLYAAGVDESARSFKFQHSDDDDE